MKKLISLLLPLTLCVACAATPSDGTSEEEGEPAASPETEADNGEPATSESALQRCGEELVTECSGGRNPGCKIYVYYRHCTSHRDSIRVKANIQFYPDGRCTTVGPNETRLIMVYGTPPGVFRRIDRC